MTLEMRGICKSFGSNDVLKHVDFSIQGGEICALLGENGAGKSTLTVLRSIFILLLILFTRELPLFTRS